MAEKTLKARNVAGDTEEAGTLLESDTETQSGGGVEELRKSSMMAHLMDALDQGTDIGHYGRLVFAMVGRHFLNEDDLLEWLQKDRDFSEAQARSLILQVQGREYNPPKRARILEWQKEQEFPICPDPGDPGACNVYKELKFPDEVYESISEFYEHRGDSNA